MADLNENKLITLGNLKKYTEKIKELISNNSYQEITYSNLKNLRDNSLLIPGTWYRITDYETTVFNNDNARAAGHPFDVVVLATDVNQLSEDAKAVHSARDTDGYFALSNLAAWKLKYSLDNDTTKFAWAGTGGDKYSVKLPIWGTVDLTLVSTNDNTYEGYPYKFTANLRGMVGEVYFAHLELQEGEDSIPNVLVVKDDDVEMINQLTITKNIHEDQTAAKGVIWEMEDDYNNLCPYDFKNIQFKRSLITSTKENPSEDECTFYGKYAGPTEEFPMEIPELPEGYTIDMNDTKFLYTFSVITTDGIVEDNSLGVDLTSAGMGIMHFCKSNRMRENIDNSTHIFDLNNNVFVSTFNPSKESLEFGGMEKLLVKGNTFGTSCKGNTFINAAIENTFGNDCWYNSFGHYCYENSFGHNCGYNTFESECYGNSFGYGCGTNSFGKMCYYNSFGDGCYENSLGHGCVSNSFGNECNSNSFGIACNGNSFGNECIGNLFGNRCAYNSFGNECYWNSFGSGCTYNSFGNGCAENLFEDGCTINSFGNSCGNNSLAINDNSNSFGNDCSGNTLDSGCTNNSFDNNCYSNTFKKGCSDNIFGNDCRRNTFGEFCVYNSFGNCCYDNSFGDSFGRNSFGNDCFYNTFKERCNHNTFGDAYAGNSFGEGCGLNSFGNGCMSNTVGDSFQKNSFGNDCQLNSFGEMCYYNSFGNYCHRNSFGNNCESNSFGNDCQHNSFENSGTSNSFGNGCTGNTFGDGCYSNSFGNTCCSNSFENNCSVNFGNECVGNDILGSVFDATLFEGVCYVSIGSDNGRVNNVQVLNGTKGLDADNKLHIDFTPDVEYTQVARLDSNGKPYITPMLDCTQTDIESIF